MHERELVWLRQVQTRADGAGSDALIPRLFSTMVFLCRMAVRMGIGHAGGLGQSTENRQVEPTYLNPRELSDVILVCRRSYLQPHRA